MKNSEISGKYLNVLLLFDWLADTKYQIVMMRRIILCKYRESNYFTSV